MDTFHWRQVIGVTGVMTLVLGGLIWFIVRDWPQEKGYPGFIKKIPTPPSLSVRRIRQGLSKVLTYRNTWLLFVIPGGVVGCILTFSGLWGVPFLITHHQLSPGRAAVLSSVLLIGWAMGAPVFGWLSDRMGTRKPLYIAGCMVVALGWSLILFRETLSFYQLVMALSVTGFFSGCMILSFAFAMESVPLSLSGTVSGLINMGVMMGPMLLQPVVGRILDNNWTGQLVNGVRVYSLDAYKVGFIPMMAWIILSVLLLFFTKETHCRQTA
jgi:sugar phosphate permease